MKTYAVTIPEVALVALTRGIGGAGVGLLAAGAMKNETRRAVGLALLAVGLITTIPIVLELFANRLPVDGREFERRLTDDAPVSSPVAD